MRTFLTIPAFLSLSLLAVLTASPCQAEPPRLHVTTSGGRTFQGALDARTGETHLFLRFGSASTIVLRRFDWQQIDQVTQDGQRQTKEALIQMAAEIEDARPVEEPPAQLPSAAEPPQAEPDASHADSNRQWTSFQPLVTHVAFNAQTAQWNRDIEADGLEIVIAPLDAASHLVPVDGKVDVELTAQRRIPFHHAPRDRGAKSLVVARWTAPVCVAQFEFGGARLRLPFQANHPELESGWSNWGDVTLRLTVPGHGVYESRVHAVRLRPVMGL